MAGADCHWKLHMDSNCSKSRRDVRQHVLGSGLTVPWLQDSSMQNGVCLTFLGLDCDMLLGTVREGSKASVHVGLQPLRSLQDTHTISRWYYICIGMTHDSSHTQMMVALLKSKKAAMAIALQRVQCAVSMSLSTPVSSACTHMHKSMAICMQNSTHIKHQAVCSAL